MVFMYFCRPPGNRGKTVAVAQLVRASDCDSEGRGFEPHQLPQKIPAFTAGIFFLIEGWPSPYNAIYQYIFP